MVQTVDRPPPPQDPNTQLSVQVAHLTAAIDHLSTSLATLSTDLRSLRAEMVGATNDLRKEAREDFRYMFAALIATALGLAGLMAKGFRWF